MANRSAGASSGRGSGGLGLKRKIILIICNVGLVAQSAMSATDSLGRWDGRGLSATDPCHRQWISISTMPNDVGMPS